MVSRRTFLRSTARAGLAGVLGSGAAAWAQRAAPPLFEEVPPSVSGLTWKHDNAVSLFRFLPESLGPGCAFLDYDNDGWMDIYLVNYGPADFFKPPRPLRNALYRNNRDGTFTDVTEKAGVAGGTFGMGAAVGDYNNDGLPDIFVTAYGRTILYRNNGDGTFTDVTAKAGVAVSGFTTSAVWFDYNGDGLLDLFVGSFVRYGADEPRLCADRKGEFLAYHYCFPHVFQPTASILFHNNGDGTFRRVERGTAIGRSRGKVLGAVATDINNDGRMDIYAVSDTAPNFLFVNGGKNTWQEKGLQAGVAVGATGRARSGMGVDAADVDGDGWQDLFVANVDQEMYSLYRNEGKGEYFTDVARDHGIAEATRLMSGWGLKFFDFDNDGNVDLLLGNGHPDDTVHQRAPGVTYREPLLLFRSDGKRLRDISAQAGPIFGRPLSARGLAVGDFNNDGRVDVLVGDNGNVPLLLKNNAGQGNGWLGIKLQGTSCTRDAVGARLRWSAGGRVRERLKTGGGSYLSSHDPREVLGLGAAQRLDWLEVTWPAPSGRTERFTDLPANRYVTIVEGKGAL
jgi:enediyne biosynthesis protein E4